MLHLKSGFKQVLVEKGAGEASQFSDDEYVAAGATLVDKVTLPTIQGFAFVFAPLIIATALGYLCYQLHANQSEAGIFKFCQGGFPVRRIFLAPGSFLQGYSLDGGVVFIFGITLVLCYSCFIP